MEPMVGIGSHSQALGVCTEERIDELIFPPTEQHISLDRLFSCHGEDARPTQAHTARVTGPGPSSAV